METILINWLREYTMITNITLETKFDELNFDLFDQAMITDFVEQTLNKNINRKETWYNTVRELINDLS